LRRRYGLARFQRTDKTERELFTRAIPMLTPREVLAIMQARQDASERGDVDLVRAVDKALNALRRRY
jgi:hypothetical protein